MSEALDIMKQGLCIIEEQSRTIVTLNEKIKKYQELVVIQEKMIKNFEKLINIKD